MKKKNSSKLKWLNIILVIAIIMLGGLTWIYFSNIIELTDVEKGNWGTFGDFMGGTLNPIFALFSLFAIIYTIKIQTEELELSRQELEETKEELRESRIAQQEQSKSLELQNKATEQQIFENTFFQLITLHNETKNNLYYFNSWFNESGTSEEEYRGVELLRHLLEKLKNKHYFNFEYNRFNQEYESYTSSYFGQAYQVVKFIEESNVENKQRYVNIFRALFTKDELEFLFYHCLGKIGKRKFKRLIEEYEFFEHITHIEKKDEISKPLSEYEISAYGKNESLRKMHKEYKDKNKDKYWNQNLDE